ncbi:MAG: urease accessory protein UreH domain-containing protein, partial [Thermodesulfobacteriota bacterium]
MLELMGPLLVGLAGSLHCVGMCGPIVLAYSLQVDRAGQTLLSARVGIGHHVVFHAGRILSYMVLGAVAGAVAHLVNLQAFMGHLRGIVSLVGGMLLVLMGLVLLKA